MKGGAIQEATPGSPSHIVPFQSQFPLELSPSAVCSLFLYPGVAPGLRPGARLYHSSRIQVVALSPMTQDPALRVARIPEQGVR